MARSAFVLGGTGLIGRALVPRLIEEGYAVTVGSRSGTNGLDGNVTHVRVDRDRDDEFDAATRRNFDLFVDIVAYNKSHAEQLVRLKATVGSFVVVSSAAVYADRYGRTLLGSEAGTGERIVESDPLVAPVADGSDYAGGKVGVEQTLLDAELPVTILRPGAIFGPGDRASREWHFVKRALDDRAAVPLAYDGESVFHQVSSASVAEMTMLAAERPRMRILNCGDPAPMKVRDIAHETAVQLEHNWDVVTFPGPPRGSVGETPWTTPRPFVLDLSLATRELGFCEAIGYPAALGRTIDWLLSETSGRLWQEGLPAAAANYSSLFDYDAEDRFIEELRRQ